MRKNQKGFSVVEILLIFIVVGIIGFAGWYVWNSNKQVQDSYENAAVANNGELPKSEFIDNFDDCIKLDSSTIDKNAFPQTCTTKSGKKFADTNPTKGWKTYDTKSGKYSLKHPDAWSEDSCDSGGTDEVLYLGPTKASSVICNSEHGSQIMFVSTTATPTESEQNLGDEYKDVSIQEVKVDGLTGERQGGKLKEAMFGVPANTLVVTYFFLTSGRSYIASYLQSPSGDYTQDNLAEFDYMIQKTTNFTD